MTGEERRNDRLTDLLAQRATEGLSAQEEQELTGLLVRHPEVDPEELDRAAALAQLAFLSSEGGELEPLPAGLRQRLEADGSRFVAAASRPARTVRPSRTGSWFSPRFLGWYTAAAMLLLAVVSWRIGETVPVPLMPGQAREQLVQTAADLVQVSWNAPQAPGFEAVTGDVVWSGEQQAGFLRLRGLPVNSPAQEQYQLWIVDPQRDQNPVDGGVFDIPAGDAEVIIPIAAKLEVLSPQAFAITLEQPGGVVVSDGPLLVVAPVGA